MLRETACKQNERNITTAVDTSRVGHTPPIPCPTGMLALYGWCCFASLIIVSKILFRSEKRFLNASATPR